MSRNIYVTLGCKIQAINLACPQCLQKVKPQGLYTLNKVHISVSKSFIIILFWHFIFSLSLCQIWVLVASHGSYLFLFVASHGFSLCQLLLILWLKVENYVYLSAFQKSIPKVHKISRENLKSGIEIRTRPDLKFCNWKIEIRTCPDFEFCNWKIKIRTCP